jgi:probable FeS assembly SUF system protein SufT
MRQARTLSRDIEVTAIPYGDRLPLKEGSTVFVTQALGGSFTCMTDHGYMVRIDGQDADAIGEEAVSAAGPEEAGDRSVEQLCWDQLKTCYDPEIPVNIVDLGLVYACEAAPVPDEAERHRVKVRFTLTAPGCGMGDYLKQDIERKLLSVPGVKEADVQIAFDPPWTQDMMSEAARLQLGMM